MLRGDQNQLSGCHSFIGGSGAEIIRADRSSVLQLWRDEAGPQDLSGKPSSSQPCDSVSAKQPPVRAVHAKLVATLVGHPPRTIPLEADDIDLEDRADHLNKVLSALSVYVTVILDDTAQNVPGGFDLWDIEAVLADLSSDVTGTIQRAADGMAGRVA